jgi:hypothetical protein
MDNLPVLENHFSIPTSNNVMRIPIRENTVGNGNGNGVVAIAPPVQKSLQRLEQLIRVVEERQENSQQRVLEQIEEMKRVLIALSERFNKT